MAKKNAEKPKTTAKSEAPALAAQAEAPPSPAAHIVGGLRKFNFNARPAAGGEQMIDTAGIRPSYERIQQEAKGPGADEWRAADKARAELTELYRNLQEDERYAPEYKSERAWRQYEETRAQIEKLAPEARAKMLRSAESLERLSVPVPEGEGLTTKDTNKLLLSAHERSRIEGLINRAEKVADKGPFKANPTDILKREYARSLGEGGPLGGATVRAVYELARDWTLDIHTIVDEHRKPRHHEALEQAQQRRMQADVVGRSVPEPPFERGGGSVPTGLYNNRRPNNNRRPKAFIPNDRMPMQFERGRPYWK